MASRKINSARPEYIYRTEESSNSNDQSLFEFDESDIWDDNDGFPIKNRIPSSRSSKKDTKMINPAADQRNRETSSSLPVNIPDWSRILKEEYRRSGKRESEDDFDSEEVDVSGSDDEDGGGRIRVPPHEYLARRGGASLSVHEGTGRTLKGRDLSRVRNAILKQTGFLD